jgi:hypothetical protein
MNVNDVAAITLQPATLGISLAYGQTQSISAPSAVTCKGTAVGVGSYSWGTSNNKLVDLSPSGAICAGTWNRNTGGGIANYTICNPPDPAPSTNGLPYAVAYITASSQSITSNPVPVYVHAPAASVSLVTTPLSGIAGQQCYSKGAQAALDAQVCVTGADNKQYLICAPPSVTSANSSCPMPAIAPNILATGNVTGFGGLSTGIYQSGGSISGAAGQTCSLTGFNNGSAGAVATVTLTGANMIAAGSPLMISAGGSDAAAAPTTATLSNGTATCSGSATVTSTVTSGSITGSAGQSCNLSLFNNGSSGSTATAALTGTNSIAAGSPLVVSAGGSGATAPPTTAQLSNGTAVCSGTISVATTLTPVPDCTSSVGVLYYNVSNPSVASLTSNTATNQAIITAALPGTTPITASLSGSGSSAGFFSTCPPKSINLTLANGETVGTITRGVTQNLVTTVIDTNNVAINGLTLNYQSTDPVDISVSGNGSITTDFPGVASIYAVCEPSVCNSAPVFQTGLFGTGLPVTSNPVTITTPGTASDYLWFAAPGQSQYVYSIELLLGSTGSAVRLPFVPNSMVMNPVGNTIYFGSPHELMTFSTSSNTVISQNTATPGVALAVSPDGSTILINDQDRQIFYLLNVVNNSSFTFGGMGNAAVWTPDSKTLYITDNAALNNPAQGISGHTDTLYVYNQNTGWVTYPLPPSPLDNPFPPGVLPTSVGSTLPANTLAPNTAISATVQNPAITIPSVGAFLRGTPTVAHTWCPSGTVGNYSSINFYPGPNQTADSTKDNVVNVQSDVLTATTDGYHILGATTTGGVLSLNDIDVSIPSLSCLPAVGDPDYPLNLGNTLSPLVLNNQVNTTQLTPPPSVGTLYATSVNQIVASPASNLAFITYTALESNTNALLPYYQPNTTDPSQPGTVSYLKLAAQSGGASPSAPLAGAFTADDKTFFVSTAGDNMIHTITIPPVVTATTPPTDTPQLNFSPNLQACVAVSAGGTDLGCTYSGHGTIVPATAIAIKARPTT